MPIRLLLPLLLLTATAAGCDPPRPVAPPPPATAGIVAPAISSAVIEVAPPLGVLAETFDEGHKGKYAKAEISLPSGPWTLDDALIGASEQDRKTGRAALRVQAGGRAAMAFDVIGAVRLTVRVATYGHDAAAPWQLQYSENQGQTWRVIGATFTAKPGDLAEMGVGVVAVGAKPVRFAFKHAGADGRINFDDFRLELSNDLANPATTAIVVPAEVPPVKNRPTSAATASATSTGTVRNRLGVAHLAFGNPSGAATADPTNYLLQRPEYVLSYNRTTNTANWVGWHLSQRWKGNARRTPSFSPDEALPAAFYRVSTGDYIGSGFDRGHLCPSDDRDFSPLENAATFRLTNIIPQAPANNQGPWRELEEYARTLAARGAELYILAGPAGRGGTGTSGPKTTIGRAAHPIAVPRWTWKIIAVVPRGAATAAFPVPTRVIAIQMPNDQAVEHHHWPEYRVSVRQLEKLTGYDFFSTLPKDAQTTLETCVDDGPTR